MGLKALFFIILALFCGVSCKNNEQRVLSDKAGNRIVIPNSVEKIMSTAPSNTEIIADLGLAAKLIAIDKYSRDVPGVRSDLPEIDFFYPDAEYIISLDPDIIIASEHNIPGTGSDPFALIREAGIPVAYIPTSGSIEGIYEDIDFISKLLGKSERGGELIAEMKNQIDGIRRKGAGITEKKSVYFEISPFPI
jgi:iron complex transport system substrate-binding protein